MTGKMSSNKKRFGLLSCYLGYVILDTVAAAVATEVVAVVVSVVEAVAVSSVAVVYCHPRGLW